eukprot:TRINITY_DN14035_c0_g1_i2.p1 TRINITY_DN14035_c0_g1~~TRINITY_DN14035_c0_g1_i2.p1  ORF type:complete len:172 (+),score=50.52 TRINITY_DN14035_c0_g1_i2:3-518(+)
MYPGWEKKHCCIGESFVQVKASAAAFVGSSPPALVSLARHSAYTVNAGIGGDDVLDPWTFAGMTTLGAMLLFAFSSAAQEMVEECNEQFKTILQQGVKPDCDRCSKISSGVSMQQMIAPGLLMTLFPPAADVFFGKNYKAGLLTGADQWCCRQHCDEAEYYHQLVGQFSRS